MISGVNGDFQIYFLLNIMGIFFFTVHAGKKSLLLPSILRRKQPYLFNIDSLKGTV